MVLILALLTSFPARALTFTAAKNISTRLAVQNGRVGGCTDVSIFMLTRHEVDVDHDYLGMEGVMKDGRRFVRMKEFGLNGALPRAEARGPGRYRLLTAHSFGRRHPILTLRTNDAGVITDLELPRGGSLCL